MRPLAPLLLAAVGSRPDRGCGAGGGASAALGLLAALAARRRRGSR